MGSKSADTVKVENEARNKVGKALNLFYITIQLEAAASKFLSRKQEEAIVIDKYCIQKTKKVSGT
jgi:hypothetical protein